MTATKTDEVPEDDRNKAEYLQALAAQITANVRADRAALVKDLKKNHELKITTNKKSGALTAKMADITAKATGGEAVVLTNWANAARRAVKDMAA